MSNTPSVTKILFFSAEPTDAARLRLGKEYLKIDERWRQATQRDLFEVELRPATGPLDLQQQILANRPAVVHFSGHGAGMGGLALENDAGGTHLVSTEALANLLRLFKGHVRCVVLNSCFSAVQAEAIGRYIPYVVGMTQEIGDCEAIDFSYGFYDALFNGESFGRAFDFGCSAIQLESLPDALRHVHVPTSATAVEALPEHLKPVLFKSRVFLSHSSADKPAVEELARRLEGKEIKPELDKWNLIPGDPWQPAIEQALASCASCAVFIGPGGFGAWQNEEMRAAIDRRVGEGVDRFRVIPVLLPAPSDPSGANCPRS